MNYSVISYRESDLGGVNGEEYSPPFQASPNMETTPALRSFSTAEGKKSRGNSWGSLLDYRRFKSVNNRKQSSALSSSSGGASPRINPEGTIDWDGVSRSSPPVESRLSTSSSENRDGSILGSESPMFEQTNRDYRHSSAAPAPKSTSKTSTSPPLKVSFLLYIYIVICIMIHNSSGKYNQTMAFLAVLLTLYLYLYSLVDKLDQEENMNHELNTELEQFLAEAESSQREVSEESIRRKKAEKDAIDANHRVTFQPLFLCFRPFLCILSFLYSFFVKMFLRIGIHWSVNALACSILLHLDRQIAQILAYLHS